MVISINIKELLHSGTKPYLPVDHFAKFTELIDINKMPLLIKHLIHSVDRFSDSAHPFYLSVTELKYNASKKSMVSCNVHEPFGRCT